MRDSRLATLADNRDEEIACRDLLQRTAQPQWIPIPFCRIEAERTCGLFYNPDTRRYYARLYVVSPRSRFARPITAAGRYVDVRSGAVYLRDADARCWHGMHSFGRSRTSILVPLELGRWHETTQRFTTAAFLPPRTNPAAPAAVPVSACLVKRGEAYRLHVNFQFPTPPRLPATTLLGIDRGITCLAAGAVLSADGRQVLDTLQVDGRVLGAALRRAEAEVAKRQARGRVVRSHRRTRLATAAVHACANQIVELAYRHRAQVVMEDLLTLAKPRHITAPTPAKGSHPNRNKKQRTNFNAMLPRRQYQKLIRAVNARLAVVGLPPVRLVSPSFTSITCSRCGHVSAANRSREDRERFCCVACGFEAHADVQAGINIARKTLWLTQRIQEAKAQVPTAERTSWPAFIRAFLAASIR